MSRLSPLVWMLQWQTLFLYYQQFTVGLSFGKPGHVVKICTKMWQRKRSEKNLQELPQQFPLSSSLCPMLNLTWEDKKNQCGTKELGGDHGESRSILFWRVIIWKAKVSMWNKKCWGMRRVWCGIPSLSFPLNFIHWKCSIYGKYLRDQCQSSTFYIL